ncbi:AAA domain-containing protein [Corynebacterium pseudodiphtheriticum]|uniref:AAA domain-containing protein n=1 Tax=Corynebacterium pseudodiphtheriticum TaxID=37637 RepID=UPI0020BF13DD|nr:AAA domain-containing protein [Corynebacterium pseudodiphtheriticum]UQV57664.1 AAA domain-containing protein [Corynebacterium pseudodiphtheriticum]
MQVNADKASRLFEFLSALQKTKEKIIFSTAEYKKDGGKVLTFERLKELAQSTGQVKFGEPICSTLDLEETYLSLKDSEDSLLVSFKKPAALERPSLPTQLENFVIGSVDDALQEPKIDTEMVGSEQDRVQLDEWMASWRTWATAEKYSLAYKDLFEIQTSANQHADEFELILGLGNLTWKREGGVRIDRHLFTSGLSIRRDKITGDIEITLGDGELKTEFDAVPADCLHDGTFLSDVKTELSRFDGEVFDPAAFASLGAVTAHGLDTQAVYHPDWRQQAVSERPVISWQPTIILRKRQQTGFASAFKNIANAIEVAGVVPAGLATLIDPNSQAEVQPVEEPGATFESNSEIFTPLPLNAKQLQVLKHVDTHAQTIVQGPPGTGKTHMAAALLSHLLAQGKRVLVTAQAARALYELRDKLPEEIRELAVSVINSGQSDLAELEVAVDTISRRSSDYDHAAATRDIHALESSLNQLQEQRTAELRKWTSLMESERDNLAIPGYDMQMSHAVEKWLADKPMYEWIDSLQVPDLNQPFPLTPQELDEWFSLLDSEELSGTDVTENGDEIDFSILPTVEELVRLVEAERELDSFDGEFAAQISSSELASWSQLAAAKQTELSGEAESAVEKLQAMHRDSLPWVDALLSDARSKNLFKWKNAVESLTNDFAAAKTRGQKLDNLRAIDIKGNVDSFVPIARALQKFLQDGGVIKTKVDGLPKAGLFTKPIIKDSFPFFEQVRINGVPPTSSAEIDAYLDYVELEWALGALQRSWNYSQPASNLTPREKIGFWQHELETFSTSVEQVEEIVSRIAEFNNLGFGVGIADLDSFPGKLRQLKALSDAQTKAAGYAELISLGVETTRIAKSTLGPLAWIDGLQSALESRDVEQYRTALESARGQAALSGPIRRRNELTSKASRWSALFVQMVVNSVDSTVWRARASETDKARFWALAGEKIKQRSRIDLEELSSAIRMIDQRISATISELAAARAWSKAVGKDRIDPATQSNLVAYSQAVKRLGKGTGKYAAQHKRDVRKHLASCRSAVPVWIMPIYKVVEQFDLTENMFDVVIVDEASQSGIDAIFLQYLAPRMVVIGDDKQVSPTSFRNQDGIRKLAQQYLSDFDKIDSWADPARSLFDEANMRYGGRITLEEHRRCVPEIIGFSNRFIYEPENISLKPVREPEADRLAPFKITRTPNAFWAANKSKKVNQAEADTLVERLVSVLDDPQYDGKTIGVISLLSDSGQAAYIQARLIEKVLPEVWQKRDLKVGSPAEFQGAERDVMFLSMVQPVIPGKKASLLAKKETLQRYNVAVSRAKDQVWLFHSIGFDDLNPNDIRAQLLQYAYGVAEKAPELAVSASVPNDVRVEPFDSLFEQRVYNRIVENGYQVTPQYPELGYRIDLVVTGVQGRLAVECDGDYWHSDQNALRDQHRQRELERLGWTFVRIFESDFYLDSDAQMQKVWSQLNELGITPASADAPTFEASKNVEILEAVYADGEPDSLTTLAVDAFSENDGAAEDSSVEGERLYAGSPILNSEDISTYKENKMFATPDFDNQLAATEFASAIEKTASDGEETLSAADVRKASVPYVEFTGSTVSVQDASDGELAEGFLRILSQEAPMTGSYLYSRYVKCAGDIRVTKYVELRGKKILSSLIRTGELRVSQKPERGDFAEYTFYLPHQSPMKLRTRGPRKIDEIPFDELTRYVLKGRIRAKTDDREKVMREALKLLDLKRLTSKTEETLLPHYELVMQGKAEARW